MPSYETPGVYWEGRDATPPAIDPARMDVAGLIGIARKGPLHTAVPVESARQFEAHFGSFTGAGYLAYAVKAFFDNGGRRTWIVRVACSEGAGAAQAAGLTVTLPPMPLFPDWPAAWRIAASTAGSWGNALEISIRPGARIAATTIPAGSSVQALHVPGTAGFGRDSLVRISDQSGTVSVLRILAGTDAANGLLWLINPESRLRRVFEQPLAGLDPLQPLRVESLSYTIVVREAGLLTGLATDLSLVPGHPRYAGDVLTPPDYSFLTTRAAPPAAPFPACVVPLATLDAPAMALEPATGAFTPLTGGADGLDALSVPDFIGEPFPPEAGLTATRRGLQVFERVAEPACLAIPDILIHPEPDPQIEPPPFPTPDPCAPCPAPALPAPLRPRPVSEMPPLFSQSAILQVQQALVEHCESRRDRIALLDPPLETVDAAARGLTAVQAWRAQFDSRYAAFYMPWLQVSDPLFPGELRAVPPSGHAAGQYALADITEGVHRAPANRDVQWAEAVTLPVRDAEHGLLNSEGINVIRPVLGRALRIMGARTVSSDPDARFVPVRRLIMMLIRTFDRTTQWAVFEPNDHNTRSNLTVSFGNFLQDLWQRGALVGATQDEAFAVRCDETNNPPQARDNGQLFCDIAIAPVAPLEFIVLRIGRVDGELEVQEQSVSLKEATA